MQNFDIVNLEKVVDWFNVMTYDLHGTWYVDFEAFPASRSLRLFLGTRRTNSLAPSSMPIPILPRLIRLWICFGAILYALIRLFSFSPLLTSLLDRSCEDCYGHRFLWSKLHPLGPFLLVSWL